MSSEQQLSQESSDAEMDRQTEELILQGRMRNIRRKLLVLSGKGGVGKSTVAVNLAMSLAKEGKKVGLLDIDIHGPSVPKLLGLEDGPIEINSSEIIPRKVNDNLSVMSIGFLLENLDDPVIWRGPRKHGMIRQFLAGVAWGSLDYLVVDSPPGTGDEPLSIAQLVGTLAGAVIVTTPQDISIADVRRCISFCKAVSLPIVGIIENMSGYVCPKCGEETNIFKSGGGKNLSAELEIAMLGRIPIDPNVVSSGDAGTPFVANPPESSATRAFTYITKCILASSVDVDNNME